MLKTTEIIIDLIKPAKIDVDCKFIKDLESKENLERNYNMGMWNLVLTIRDLKLFTQGIKPYRHWRLSSVKNYFGIKGDKHTCLKTLTKIKRHLSGV